LKNKEKRTGTYRPKGNSDEGNASVAATTDSSDRSEVLVAFAGCANNGDEWILDPAASFHICINRDWFITYDSVQGDSVKMGDDSSHQIIGIGSVQIKMHDGIIRTLTDVRRIPDMSKNLISLSTLDGKGYKYSGGYGVLKVSKGSLIVMRGDLKSANLYRL
jgi:5'-3' exoribonuclease 2